MVGNKVACIAPILFRSDRALRRENEKPEQSSQGEPNDVSVPCTMVQKVSSKDNILRPELWTLHSQKFKVNSQWDNFRLKPSLVT